jgi:hypothetical protein
MVDMAVSKEKVTYPMISTNAWWALRRKFRQSIPTRVTDSYLASVLNMQQKSASVNVLSPLKRMGLIDNDGKPTERATWWRDDERYSSVCEEIRKEIYSQEILDAFPERDASRDSIARWFLNETGLGDNASKKMAAVYSLLVEADPTKQDSISAVAKTPRSSKATSSSSKANGKATRTTKPNKVDTVVTQPSIENQRATNLTRSVGDIGLSLHIDIQIHIPPDTSAEQIDNIFASMAKHLYRNDVINE